MAEDKQQDIAEELEETVSEENEDLAEASETEEESTESAKNPEEEAEDTETAEGEETSDKKEGFFKKKKKDKKDEQIEELNDRLRRQMAEFDNFRKRTEKEKSQMFDMGARTIVEKILPVVDNFERGFTTVDEEDKEDAFVLGMDKVYKQLMF